MRPGTRRRDCALNGLNRDHGQGSRIEVGNINETVAKVDVDLARERADRDLAQARGLARQRALHVYNGHRLSDAPPTRTGWNWRQEQRLVRRELQDRLALAQRVSLRSVSEVPDVFVEKATSWLLARAVTQATVPSRESLYTNWMTARKGASYNRVLRIINRGREIDDAKNSGAPKVPV